MQKKSKNFSNLLKPLKNKEKNDVLQMVSSGVKSNNRMYNRVKSEERQKEYSKTIVCIKCVKK